MYNFRGSSPTSAGKTPSSARPILLGWSWQSHWGTLPLEIDTPCSSTTSGSAARPLPRSSTVYKWFIRQNNQIYIHYIICTGNSSEGCIQLELDIVNAIVQFVFKENGGCRVRSIRSAISSACTRANSLGGSGWSFSFQPVYEVCPPSTSAVMVDTGLFMPFITKLEKPVRNQLRNDVLLLDGADYIITKEAI